MEHAGSVGEEMEMLMGMAGAVLSDRWQGESDDGQAKGAIGAADM